MIKKNGNVPHAVVGVACSTCVHFKGVALFAKPCSELGIAEYALAPKCYVPDVHQLIAAVDSDLIANLGRLCSKLDPDQVRLLAYTLSNVADVQATPFKFGQPVYFSLGDDYVAHYYRGYLVSVKDDVATISATLNRSAVVTSIVMPVDSLLSKSMWRRKLEKLVAAGRFYDTEVLDNKRLLAERLSVDGTVHVESQIREALDDGQYEPPTIDMCDDDLIARYRQEAEKKKKMRTGKAKGKPRKIGFDISTTVMGGASVFSIADGEGQPDAELELEEEV